MSNNCESILAGNPSIGKHSAAAARLFALVFATLEIQSYRHESATWDEPVHVMDGYSGDLPDSLLTTTAA